MKQHVQDTITEIETRITDLAALRNVLINTFGAGDEVACINGIPAPITPPAKVGRVAPRVPAPKSKRTTKSTKPIGGFCGQILQAAQGLASPFDVDDLHAVLKSSMTRDQVRWNVPYMIKRGLLKTVTPGYGGYLAKLALAGKHSKPSAPKPSTPPPSTNHIPGLDPEPKGTIAEQLERALKDRDAATASGQDRLAKILQDKVDKLTKQLG